MSRHCRILLVACVSPSIDCAKETFRTLQFAKKAMVSKAKAAKRTKSKHTTLRAAYMKERLMRQQLESLLLESKNAELKIELYKLREVNAELLEGLRNMSIKKAKRKKKVKFIFALDDESLDSDRRERMISNWERSETVKRAKKCKPYESYFREPVNINAGYLGGKKLEDDPGDVLPKGKFAFLNNSLKLEHERINLKKRKSKFADLLRRSAFIQKEKRLEKIQLT